MSKDACSLEYKKEHHKYKWHNDPKWRAVQYANSILSTVINRLKYPTSYSKHLQCTKQELIDHLEKQFTKDMNWQNYGKYWQINHKKPLRQAYEEGEESFKEAQHFQNLEPIQREKNCKEKTGKTFKRRIPTTSTNMV